MCNLVFSDAPTEQDLLALAQRGEVDEALVEVLDDRAPAVDRVHAARDADPSLALGLLGLGDRPRVEAATVPGDLHGELLAFGLEPLLFAAVDDEFLGERPDLLQLLVGLGRCEVARHLAPMIRGVVVAGQRVEKRRPNRLSLPPMPPTRSAVEIFLWSRALIWFAALFALMTLEPMRNPKFARWDDPSLTHDLGAVTDVWARWDAVHFLRIAEHGYSATEAAFYPLYPALVAVAGRALGGHYVLGGILISLAATLGAFILLERLAEQRLGGNGARRAVLYLAIFPTAFFLQAVYSESLYLFLCLAAFALAERGRLGEADVF